MNSSLGHIGHVVKSFLDQHWDQKSGLLIGYSGGSDSKALLYATIAWGKAPIHIAHVDHGWRSESAQEALLLQKEAEELKIPFHSIRLEKKTTETQARQCRLAFFHSLQKQFSLQAVLLGHQADDLAETVLKRLFEGAHLPQLCGMKAISIIDDVVIWRPLLFLSKNEIRESLVDRQLEYFDDATNYDSRYLRARMRSGLLPFLNQTFGKNISENLAVLSERSRELDDYLSLRSAQFKKFITKGPFGWWVDGRQLHRLELRYLIQQVAEQEKIVCSRPLLESILNWMEHKKPNCLAKIQHRSIVIDRGHFFLLSNNMPRFDQPIVPSRVRQNSGDWVIQEIDPAVSNSDWQTLWRDGEATRCFDNQPILQLPSSKIRWLAKVPHFLKKICPILIEDGKVIADFVSGQMGKGPRCIKISVTRSV